MKYYSKNCELAELSNGTPIIKIMFPYDVGTLDQVRSIKGRLYHSSMNCWSCPVSGENIETLSGWGFTFDARLTDVRQRSNETKVEEIKPIEIPGLKGTLRPFQNTGVGFFEQKKGRALNADQMGLGKTIQALAWLQLRQDLRPAVIVVPASLKLNWLYEMEKWMTKPKAIVVSGKTPYHVTADIIIINYDILEAWKEKIISKQPKVIIFDEVHSIKNNTAKRTLASKEISKGIPNVIGLSGTPVLNRPIELYNICNIIDPTLLGSYYHFAYKYCGAKKGRFGLTVNGATNTNELHKILTRSVMIRRLKQDVLQELPDKQTSLVPIEITNRGEYDFAEDQFVSFMMQTKGEASAMKAIMHEALMKLGVMRQLVIKGKMQGAIDWIEEFLESGEKLVVFATHTSTIDALMEAFPKVAVQYDGRTPVPSRQGIVDKFQNDPKTRLFVGMIDNEGRPAGVGITLTAAWATATVEFLWGPSAHEQADDRIHRMGQKNACINYKLVAKDTIDEKIISIQESKRQIIESVIDGKEIKQLTIMQELMKAYRVNDMERGESNKKIKLITHEKNKLKTTFKD